MTAGSAGARLASGATAAGVSCTGRAIDDCPTAAVVVATIDGVESMGNAMDDAPASGVDEVVTAGATETDEVVSTAADVLVVTAVLELSTTDDELDDEMAAASEVLELMATELDDEIPTALDVLESTAAELDDGTAASAVLESRAAELEDEIAAAADVLESTATGLDDETAIALDVLGSTTVDREVSNEFNGVNCFSTQRPKGDFLRMELVELVTTGDETDEVTTAGYVPMSGIDEVAATVEEASSAKPEETT
ncbi:hypothetical protein FHL15_004083 [Xylaria flabelliformis]|uniref:Uncharacterized protein n=1 Tax=Xylaria flabelliformis TaxID=2512241 RepID=A0A553I455_9PEZI|nr:hypothetical protein FHL15_004083 [Xylaria flabelliformis]